MVRSRSRRFCASRKGSEHTEKSSLQARKLASCLLKNPRFTARDTQPELGRRSPARSRVLLRCNIDCLESHERTQCGFLHPAMLQRIFAQLDSFSAAISAITIGFEISMTTLSGRSLWAASSPMLSGISPPSCVMISALFPTTAYRTFPTQTKRMGFSGDDRPCKCWNFSTLGEN